MNLQDRVKAFGKLGYYLSAIDEVAFRELVDSAKNENPWFTKDSINYALAGLSKYLDKIRLEEWVSSYNLTDVNPKVVAVVMAGNVPLVGFHDFLCVLISGHSILIKHSSRDSVLIKHIVKKLVEIEPRFEGRIMFAERLKNFDAVIATGSDNSARYFHYYFDKYPNIIRKNRTSCAILNGKESGDELKALGSDVFSYFGLGCRNVSKIFIPEKYNFNNLLESWSGFKDTVDHHKYHNNYDYQKSILLVNRIPFLDNGFVMLQESKNLVSPISVVYYETYEDEGSLALTITAVKEKLQCIVGRMTPASVAFGQAQSPSLRDYADQTDTLKFLERLG